MTFATRAAIAGLIGLLSAGEMAHAQQQPIPLQPVRPDPAPPPRLHPEATYTVLAGTRFTMPNVDEVAAAYPPRAVTDQIEGMATVDCLIETDGSIRVCDIVRETPEGYGFGEATVGIMVHYFHLDPASVPGGIKPDTRYKTTWRWQLP